MKEGFIIIGVAVLVLALLILWIVLVTKSRNKYKKETLKLIDALATVEADMEKKVKNAEVIAIVNKKMMVNNQNSKELRKEIREAKSNADAKAVLAHIINNRNHRVLQHTNS